MNNGTVQEVKPWLFDLQLHGGKAGEGDGEGGQGGEGGGSGEGGSGEGGSGEGGGGSGEGGQGGGGRTYDEAYVTRLRREKADAEKKAKDLEKAEQDRIAKEAQEKDDQKKLAKLEKERADKLQKQLDDVTSKSQQRVINAELRSLAREMGLLDLDDLKLLDKTGLEVTDEDEVIGAKELLETFKKSKPHKFKADGGKGEGEGSGEGGEGGEGGKKPAPKNPPKPGDRQAKPKDAKDMDDKEFEEAWGKAGKQ